MAFHRTERSIPGKPFAVSRDTDLQAYNFNLSPSWRFDRVLQMVDRVPTPGRTTRRDDDYIKHMRSFLLRWRPGDDKVRASLEYENPGLYWAYQIYEQMDSDPDFAFEAEARLLANMPLSEIAHTMHTKPEVIEWYEALFFNVLPRLTCRDWVKHHVIMPASERFVEHGIVDGEGAPVQFNTPEFAKPHMDWTVKFFSYYGGPVMCEFMLHSCKTGQNCPTQDEIGNWLVDNYNHAIQKRAAQTAHSFRIDKWSVELLFMTNSRILELQKGVEGIDERRTAVERHIQAMLTEIPWTVGDKATEVFAGSRLGALDQLTAELRDDELMMVAAGESPLQLESLPSMKFPLGPETKEPPVNGHLN